MVAKAATGIAAKVKDAYYAIDDKVIEPIDENVLKPVFDALEAAVKYAAETAEACIDEALIVMGVGQRAKLNRPALTMATCASRIEAEAEAYWNGRTFQTREEKDKGETWTDKISGFFSRIW